ncbi:MAG TPA: hypothetical protein VM686_31865, partial [Polyangiaceae bacterium]|nr:hypothetical protein [Polyangiaceae bacterium]
VYPHSVDHVGDDEVPEDAIATGDANLWCARTLNTWKIVPTEAFFAFPKGVIPARSATDGELDPAQILEGYAFDQSDDDHELHVVVDGRRLWQVFRELFAALPSRDGLEVRLMHHWEDQENTQVFLAHPSLTSTQMLAFLDTNAVDLIDNGGVELGIYCRREQCTLRLTEHKTIAFYAKPQAYVADLARVVGALSLIEREPLLSIAHRCAHFHYAPKSCTGRAQLVRRLEGARFRLVNEWSDETG